MERVAERVEIPTVTPPTVCKPWRGHGTRKVQDRAGQEGGAAELGGEAFGRVGRPSAPGRMQERPASLTRTQLQSAMSNSVIFTVSTLSDVRMVKIGRGGRPDPKLRELDIEAGSLRCAAHRPHLEHPALGREGRKA